METRGEKNNLVDTALRQEVAHGVDDTRAVRVAPQPDAAHQPDIAHQPNATPQPDTALILEGGSFRGIFTAGVLDVLLEHGIVDWCMGNLRGRHQCGKLQISTDWPSHARDARIQR